MNRPTIQQQIVAVDAAYRAAREELSRMELESDVSRDDRADQLTRVQQLRAARETLKNEALRRASEVKLIDEAIGRLTSVRKAAANGLGDLPSDDAQVGSP